MNKYTREEYLKKLDIPKYRTEQFYTAFYKNKIKNYNDLTTFPENLREKFKKHTHFSTLSAIKTEKVNDTIKILFKTHDNNFIEAVLIKEANHYTLCISSQIGCPINCLFCATGKLGFKRNLTYEEIIDQYLHFTRKFESEPKKRISNIVFMGMGEPLLNIDNVMKSIEVFTKEEKIDLSNRKITISTIGIIEPLKELLNEKRQYTIALSLHAATQEEREKLIPISKQNKLKIILGLLKTYSLNYKKRVTYEYILIKGINDNLSDAKKLADLFSGYEKYVFVNLIPFNSFANSNLKSSSKNQAYRFSNTLNCNGIKNYIRFSKGSEISSACGQLAGKQ